MKKVCRGILPDPKPAPAMVPVAGLVNNARGDIGKLPRERVICSERLQFRL